MGITQEQRRWAIYIAHLSLANFRNYERLDIDFQPGMTLIQGENGAGKSNLLEAIYMLAVARSPRAANERQIVRRSDAEGEVHTQIAANVQSGSDPIRLQIDFRSSVSVGGGVSVDAAADGGAAVESMRKYFRVNGAPRRAAGLVGQLNAVMFRAEDLDIVYGSPSVRRRYMNILISQSDRKYLRAVQRYERILRQRNHLLRRIRDGGAQADELAFWDDELVSAGEYIMAQRNAAVGMLSAGVKPIYAEISGDAAVMSMSYSPNVPLQGAAPSDGIAGLIRRRLRERRSREIAQGVTLTGPHRDDIALGIDGMDAGAYASRGQTRSAVLAMKLAEAAHLSERRGQHPIILMDDVLSELDGVRRVQVLEKASEYHQAFITTASADAVDERFLPQMFRFRVRSGSVLPVSSPVGVAAGVHTNPSAGAPRGTGGGSAGVETEY